VPFGYVAARDLGPTWTQWRKREKIEAIRSFRILVTINKRKQSNKYIKFFRIIEKKIGNEDLNPISELVTCTCSSVYQSWLQWQGHILNYATYFRCFLLGPEKETELNRTVIFYICSYNF
jgi:hypothetical protein